MEYNPVNEGYFLRNFDIYDQVLIFDPVHSGEERKYFKLVKSDEGVNLELVCTELAEEDY